MYYKRWQIKSQIKEIKFNSPKNLFPEVYQNSNFPTWWAGCLILNHLLWVKKLLRTSWILAWFAKVYVHKNSVLSYSQKFMLTKSKNFPSFLHHFLIPYCTWIIFCVDRFSRTVTSKKFVWINFYEQLTNPFLPGFLRGFVFANWLIFWPNSFVLLKFCEILTFFTYL